MNTQKVVGKVGKFNLGFRKEHLTSHAGTVLLHDFAQRLGVERLLEEELSVETRARGYGDGQAIGGLVYNLILGGEHLSDLDVLRGDPGTQELLEAERILAPTTAGECSWASLLSGTCTTCSGSIGSSNSTCGPTSRLLPVQLLWTPQHL